MINGYKHLNVASTLHRIANEIDEVFNKETIDPERLNTYFQSVKLAHKPESFECKVLEIIKCELEKYMESQMKEQLDTIQKYYGDDIQRMIKKEGV